jgi:hypothetical protein
MLVGVAGAQSYDGALSFANISVSPNPVVAGGSVTIRFQLYNSYDNWVYNTNLEPSGSYPLLNASPLNSYPLGTVDPGLNPRYYNYTFTIPGTTPSGEYTLAFVATYFVYGSTGTVIGSSPLPVSFFVQNRPAIKVVASNPQPATLYVGHNQTLALLIQNTGYGTARNVSVSVEGEHGIDILSSVTSFFVSNLTQGATVSEPLLVAAQSIDHPYLLANVTYYSSTFRQRFGSLQTINLSASPSAQFTLGLASPGLKIGATDVPVNFKITNTGTSDASELQLSLETSYPITPVSSTAYVSDLQPGASANLTFMVDVDSAGVPGNYPVTLFEQWKQPNGAINQQYSGSNNYYITVGSPSNNGVTDDLLYVVAIVAVAVVAYVILKRKGKIGGKSAKK